MTNLELFIILGGISMENLSGAEELQRKPPVHTGKKNPMRRAVLIAAAVALALLLVGCAVIYVLSLQEIKIGEQQTSYDAFAYDPDTGLPIEYLGKEAVTEQVLSFTGMKNTPAFQAAQEWFGLGERARISCGI